MSNLLNKYLEKTPREAQSKAAIAYLAAIDHVGETSPTISENIVGELQDQRSHLKMIASENYSSLAVQLAMGNLLTDKYAEGHTHHRFYAGCAHVDNVEEEATEEVKKLFEAEYAYVQPHSGADANLIALLAILTYKVQDEEVQRLGKKNLDELSHAEYEKLRELLLSQKLMGMSLNSGGHLTHGYRHNISSKLMRSTSYEIDPKSGLLDEKMILEQAKREKPTILLAGYSAYPRLVNFAKMREIAESVGAILMVDMAHFAGLVAGKALTGEYNPVPYADVITSTTHKTLRGPRGGIILSKKEFGDVLNRGCPMVMGGPLPHVMAAKAIAFKEANLPAFRLYAKAVIENARALAETLKKRGLKLLTDGTDNHMVIINLSDLSITGRQAERALREGHITVNRNAIPFDKNGPWYTSGIRVGTPALTTLGMGRDEMALVGNLIADILLNTHPTKVEKTGAPSKANSNTDAKVLKEVQAKIKQLLQQFPLYPEITL